MVGSEEEAIAALPEILLYDRRAVRQRFEERFSATRMAKEYVGAYRNLSKTIMSIEEAPGVGRNQANRNVGNGSTAHIA